MFCFFEYVVSPCVTTMTFISLTEPVSPLPAVAPWQCIMRSSLNWFYGCSFWQREAITADLLRVTPFIFIYLFIYLFPVQEGRRDKRGKGVSQRPFPLQRTSSPSFNTSPTLTSTRSPPRSVLSISSSTVCNYGTSCILNLSIRLQASIDFSHVSYPWLIWTPSWARLCWSVFKVSFHLCYSGQVSPIPWENIKTINEMKSLSGQWDILQLGVGFRVLFLKSWSPHDPLSPFKHYTVNKIQKKEACYFEKFELGKKGRYEEVKRKSKGLSVNLNSMTNKLSGSPGQNQPSTLESFTGY